MSDERADDMTPEEDLDIPVFDLDSDATTPVDAEVAGAPEVDEADLTDAERIERLQLQLLEMEGKWKRALADFRNFQQRSFENEKQAREDGRTAIVRALMPALDNLDLALAQEATGTPAEQLVTGMRAVADQLVEIFGGVGVTVVRPGAGDAFDPHLHQAVLQSPSVDVEPGCVMNVIQSGYMLGDRVLRPAGVIVATEASEEMKAAAEASAADAGTEADAPAAD